VGAGLVVAGVVSRGLVVGTVGDPVAGTVTGRVVMIVTGTRTVSTEALVTASIRMDFDHDWWSRSRSSRVWEPARSITVTGVVPRYTLSRYTSAPGASGMPAPTGITRSGPPGGFR